MKKNFSKLQYVSWFIDSYFIRRIFEIVIIMNTTHGSNSLNPI